jgi:hypothetical protein
MSELKAARKKKEPGNCAVFKINLEGRIVTADRLTENLLGLPEADLFGRSIQDFLNENSYQTVLSILNQTRRYETFFEAADLVLVDTKGGQHIYSVVLSLNFIGGNPANFQFMVNVGCERTQTSEAEPQSVMVQKLFDYVGSLSGHVNWDGLSRILLKIEPVIIISLHRYMNGTFHPISSALKDNLQENIQAPPVSAEHTEIAESQKPRVNMIIRFDNVSDDDHIYSESVYPLMRGDQCWGILRLVHSGDIKDIKPDPGTIAAFLGNALFSYMPEKDETVRIPV